MKLKLKLCSALPGLFCTFYIIKRRLVPNNQFQGKSTERKFPFLITQSSSLKLKVVFSFFSRFSTQSSPLCLHLKKAYGESTNEPSTQLLDHPVPFPKTTCKPEPLEPGSSVELPKYALQY